MDEVVVVEYDPRWSMMFEKEAARVATVLSRDLIVRIDHIGMPPASLFIDSVLA